MNDTIVVLVEYDSTAFDLASHRARIYLMSKTRIGLIGFGRLGSIHARNIANSKHAELYAVCDNADEALVRARSTYETRTYANIEEFLAQPIDGVVIASNTHLHLEHIRAAAKAGKHIFTEKPIGLTLEETDAVLQEVVDAGLKFQIGFQRRWDPRFLKAREAIVAGEIGEPVLFKAYGRDPNASNPANWGLDKNGGLFLNAAIHDYDAARFLMGREITKLSATGAVLVYSELAKFSDVDTCTTTLFMGSKAMAMTEWSRYASYGYDIGVEIIGTDGMIQIGHGYTSPLIVRRRDDDAPGVFEEFADAYAAELDGFAQAINNDSPTTPGVEDARIALQIALAARKSFERQEAVDIAVLNPLEK